MELPELALSPVLASGFEVNVAIWNVACSRAIIVVSGFS
jgi:hypothetical protein